MTDRSQIFFGHALKSEWLLDEDITYLNHGTVGATPRAVLTEQRRIQDEIERQPSDFLLRKLSSIRVGEAVSSPGLLRMAAAEIGGYLGAAADNLVFVDNVTAGVNAVLRSLDLRADDEVAILDLAYGGVTNAARFAARERGAVVRQLSTTAPHTARGIVDAVAEQLTVRTRIAVIDHVTAESALVLPVAEIAAVCRARGVLSLIDGAHAPGALAVDIESLNADFYSANLHKWAWAPRSCGILWARPEHQVSLHPPVVSWGLDQGFTAEFDWTGTRDPSAILAAPAGLRLMDSYGAERVRAYNHGLAWQAARYLADDWQTDFHTPEAMIGTMATIALPTTFGSTAERAASLRDALLFEDGIEVQLHAWRNRLFVRVSGQIYNDMSDVERLAGAINQRRPR